MNHPTLVNYVNIAVMCFANDHFGVATVWRESRAAFRMNCQYGPVSGLLTSPQISRSWPLLSRNSPSLVCKPEILPDRFSLMVCGSDKRPWVEFLDRSLRTRGRFV